MLAESLVGVVPAVWMATVGWVTNVVSFIVLRGAAEALERDVPLGTPDAVDALAWRLARLRRRFRSRLRI